MGFLPRVEQSLHRSLIPAAMATFATAPVLVSDPATVSATTPSLSTRMCIRIRRAPESLDFDWWIKLTRVQYHAGVAMVLAGTELWPNFMLRTLEMQTYVSRKSFSICSCSKDSSRTAIKCDPEDDCETFGNGNSPVKGGIVALGKFDALHIGHRELAVQASKAGPPFLLSFVGMAEVLGWEPRAPIVANCDRKRVLSSWASHCGNVAPKEFQMEFSSVRSLSPRQFVEKLVKEFGLSGVVAGENYRFGYRASGDASKLVRLCNEYGIDAYIINPVMDKNQDGKNIELHNSIERGQVSSTRVRYALDNGGMGYVSKLLGRRHRLVFRLQDLETHYICHGQIIAVPKSCLLNLPPKEGRYESCSFLVGEENPLPCTVLIDSENIHLEFDDEVRPHRDFSTFGVEFGA